MEEIQESIQIERLSYGAAAIGHTAEGKTLFVERAVPGDTVRVAIDENKKRYARAHITEIIEASPNRVEAPCPYYEVCGGCSWQHIDYKTQVNAKRQNIIDNLLRSTKIDSKKTLSLVKETIPSQREFDYRNKIEIGVMRNKEGKLILGFHKLGSDGIIPIQSCLIAQERITKAPKALQGLLSYLEGNRDLGIFRIGLRDGMRTNDLEVALWTTPGPFPRTIVGETLRNAFKATSVVRVIAKPGESRSVKQVEVLSGKGYWEEHLDITKFRTSAPSFFQVNTAQAEALMAEVLANLSGNGHRYVADLYAGGGTFTVPLAKEFSSVIAVEAASSSIRDLYRNAEINNVQVEILGGDAVRELPGLARVDALVVDPPRSGLNRLAIMGITGAEPKQVAYVSCDPTTWARDIALFKDFGYTLVHAQPFDLFPQSYHVEIVSILEPISKKRKYGFLQEISESMH